MLLDGDDAAVLAAAVETAPMRADDAVTEGLLEPVAAADAARALVADYNVVVLPGSFLAREARGVNPGAGFVRIALVPPYADCLEAADRIQQFVSKL